MHHWKFVMINHINIRSSKLNIHDHLSTISRKLCCVGSINPTSFYLAILHLLVNKFEALESNRNLLFFIFYRHCVDDTFRVCLFCLKCLCFCKILSPFSSMALWKSWSMKPFIAQWKIGWGEWVQPETSGSHSPCFPLERNKSFSPCFPSEYDPFSSLSLRSYVSPSTRFESMRAPLPALVRSSQLICKPLIRLASLTSHSKWPFLTQCQNYFTLPAPNKPKIFSLVKKTKLLENILHFSFL